MSANPCIPELHGSAFTDALVCAFVAQAAQLRRTHAPPSDPDGTIAREGRFHVPTGGAGDLFP
jgi:hypothetical protein